MNARDLLRHQWFGTATSSDGQQFMLNCHFELRDGAVSGRYYSIPERGSMGTTGRILVESTELHAESKIVEIEPLNPSTAQPDPQLLTKLPPEERWNGPSPPWEGVCAFEVASEDIVSGRFLVEHMDKGEFSLEPIGKHIGNPDRLVESVTWGQFREKIRGRSRARYVFRGQEQPWPLTAKFHRTGRTDLVRYIRQDVPRLHGQLVGHLDHLFNLSNPLENLSFLALAQHHGFPTPLLDWTYSPYVAAFFAFAPRRSPDSQSGDAVRIYQFDIERWREIGGNPAMVGLDAGYYALHVIDPLGIENRRMAPQQATTSFSTVRDIEEFILFIASRGVGKEDPREILKIYELSYDEREQVMDDLTDMGITHASLFPGVEGVCRYLSDRHF